MSLKTKGRAQKNLEQSRNLYEKKALSRWKAGMLLKNQVVIS
jgi:hypothetical protein